MLCEAFTTAYLLHLLQTLVPFGKVIGLHSWLWWWWQLLLWPRLR